MRLLFALPCLFLAACENWSSTEESPNEEYNTPYSSAIAFSSSNEPSSSSLEPGSSSLSSSSAGFYSSDTVHLKDLDLDSLRSLLGMRAPAPQTAMQWIAYWDSLDIRYQDSLEILFMEGLPKTPDTSEIGKQWCDWGTGPFEAYSVDTKSHGDPNDVEYRHTTLTLVLSAGDTIYRGYDSYEQPRGGYTLESRSHFQCKVQGRPFVYDAPCCYGAYTLPLSHDLYVHVHKGSDYSYTSKSDIPDIGCPL